MTTESEAVPPGVDLVDGIIGNGKQTTALLAALSKAQAGMEGAKKGRTGQVGQQKYKYADLESVIDAVKEQLGKNGLSFQQMPTFMPAVEGGSAQVLVQTSVVHAEGAIWLFSTTLPIQANPTPQQVGSAITYAKRYALQGFFGIPSEDDDGDSASRKPSAPAAQTNTVTSPDEAWRKAIAEAPSNERLDALKATVTASAKIKPAEKRTYLDLIQERRNQIGQTGDDKS